MKEYTKHRRTWRKIWRRIKEEIVETLVIVGIPMLIVFGMFFYWLCFGYEGALQYVLSCY